MSNDEFKNIVKVFEYYLKPDLFKMLMENADIFSEETKQEIVAKLQEAEGQMQQLYEYQEKRNSILERGLEKIEAIYIKLKTQFQAAGKEEGLMEATEADQLLSNL